MAKLTVKLNDSKVTQSAEQIFNESLEGGMCADTGALLISYATCREQGYGSQTLSVDYTEEIIKALVGYAENGVPKYIESADMNPVQALHDSIKMLPDGTITFKQSGKRGSKSCMFQNMDDFVGFVNAAKEKLPLMKTALENAYAEMQEEEQVEEESEG